MCWLIIASSRCHRYTPSEPDQANRMSSGNAVCWGSVSTSEYFVAPPGPELSSAMRIIMRPWSLACFVNALPFTYSAISEMALISHPAGIGPSSVSMNWSGNWSKASCGIPRKLVAAALALTGSKSMNHALKIARAIPSSVRFVRRFNSILLSSDATNCIIAAISTLGGRTIGNRRTSRRLSVA